MVKYIKEVEEFDDVVEEGPQDDDTEEFDDGTCWQCRGTGEGRNEYESCPACRGKGEVKLRHK